MQRETIYRALWERLAPLPQFHTKSRRLVHWSDVDKRHQPALFMAQMGEVAKATTGQPTQWLLQIDCYLYAFTDQALCPGEVLNPLLDALCEAVNHTDLPGRANNLGLDHVVFCRVDGKIETDEGTLGHQAVAIVPITILTT